MPAGIFRLRLGGRFFADNSKYLLKTMRKLSYISLARACAILLVVNSHATGFYPSAIANVAGRGGAIGNTLFFFISGFTLFFSLNHNPPPLFIPWIRRRYFRIWPSVWIWYGFLVLTGFSIIPWHEFFLPLHTNWFLSAILIFYPVFFFCIRAFKNYLLLLSGGAFSMFLVAFFILEPNPQSWVVGVGGSPWQLHWIYYFGIMLLGALSAQKNFFESSFFESVVTRKTLLMGFAFFVSVIVYYAMRGGFEAARLWRLQFLAPFVLPAVCIFGVAFFRLFAAQVKFVSCGKISSLINFISDHTLEIYLTHGLALAIATMVLFPVNLAFCVLLSILFSSILKFFSSGAFLRCPIRRGQ